MGRRYCSYPLMHGLKGINIRELVRFLIDFFYALEEFLRNERCAFIFCFYLLNLTSLDAVGHKERLYSVQIPMENHTTFVYQFYIRIKIYMDIWLRSWSQTFFILYTWRQLALKSSKWFLGLLLPW